MTFVGLAARRQSMKKRNAKLAAAFPNGARCQKCLEMGHWSFECKEKRKYVHRSSRTKQLDKHIAGKISDAAVKNASKSDVKSTNKAKRSKITVSESSSSESDSDSDSTTSSDDDTSSTSSGSKDSDSSSSLSSDSDSDSVSSDNSDSSDVSSDEDSDEPKHKNSTKASTQANRANK